MNHFACLVSRYWSRQCHLIDCLVTMDSQVSLRLFVGLMVLASQVRLWLSRGTGPVDATLTLSWHWSSRCHFDGLVALVLQVPLWLSRGTSLASATLTVSWHWSRRCHFDCLVALFSQVPLWLSHQCHSHPPISPEMSTKSYKTWLRSSIQHIL